MRHYLLFIYLICIILGIITGILGSLFQIAIKETTVYLHVFFIYCQQHHWPLTLISMLTSMFLVFISWLLVQKFAPEASGSGIPEIEGVLQHKRPIFWRRLLPVKFIGGVMAISAQLVAGREGPTVQMGGNLGAMLSDWFNITDETRDTLIAAGAAAGLATAFNAPLAGILFVIEEMREGFTFTFTHFKMVAIAAAVATIILHYMIGSGPVINMMVFDLPSLNALWLFVVLGIVTGIIGLILNLSLMRFLHFLDQRPSAFKKYYVLLMAAIVGVLYPLFPSSVGGGYAIIEQALSFSMPLSWMMLLLVIRFILTLGTYGIGTPGGVFAPMLSIGTLLGLIMAMLFSTISTDPSIHPGMFAVAAMGGLFAASIRAPLTGIVLVVELTQNYALILPLMITCITSTTLLQLAKNPPIYSQLLKRILDRASAKPQSLC